MSNPTTRRQHFVPRFYLKLFTDENHKFNVYDFKSNKLMPTPVYYETQCYKKYFYGEDGIWESRLSEMERKWAKSINKATSDEPLSSDDIWSLKEFVLYQRQRTSAENNRSIEEREAILKEYAKTLYFYKGWTFDEKAASLCRERAKEGVTPAEILEMASTVGEYIKDLDTLIVRYRTDNLLITTDSPVIVLNPYLKFQGFGFGSMGIAFLMPLSPSHLLVIYDGTLYSKYINELYIDSTSSSEVLAINNYELIHAERMAFSSSIKALSVNEEILEKRKKEAERNKTQFLGPEGQRLIAVQASGTNYFYELPYIALPRKYQKLPYQCREPLPREYDAGWESKLEKKYQVLSFARKIPDHISLPSNTELKIGCRRMERLAKEYWNKHRCRFGGS